MGSEVPNARNEAVMMFFIVLFGLCVGAATVVFGVKAKKPNHVPDITIQSMDFAVFNVTETRPSLNWDLLIRIPSQLPGYYMCLEGDFQVFILYKGVIISTSPKESYNLIPVWPPIWSRQLTVSTIAYEGDMDPVTVKDIMEVIKNKGEIRFGSRLILPDCRDGTTGKMKYDCDEATLQFGLGSHTNATLFGNLPNCLYVI